MKKLNKVILTLGMFLIPFTTVFADGNAEATKVVNKFLEHAIGLLKPFGGALIFVTVLLVGFDVIRHKNDADKRTQAMSSLLWVAIGAVIIGASTLLAGFLWSGSQITDENILGEGNVNEILTEITDPTEE